MQKFPGCFARKKRMVPIFLLFCFSGISGFAQIKINGVVIGSDSLPLEGAVVTNKTANTSTVTSSNGSYAIAAQKGDLLVFSFVGYTSRQIEVQNDVNINVSLQISVIDLDDLVVTGYTIQRVKEITGSVVVVKSKDLTAIPAGQLLQMLQGRVAGLNIITSGMPGDGSNVRLHGIGNFGDVTPLYVIDGVPGNINNLNPYDIESVQVLKDAGAYSIYGVRGANGVIVITTRSGKQGKTRIDYDFYMGTTSPLKGLEVLNPEEMAQLTWIAKKNSGNVDPVTGNPDDPFYGNGVNPVLPDYFIDASIFKGYFEGDPEVDPGKYNIDFTNGLPIYQITATNKKGTNWFREIFTPAFSQSHNFSVSGANERNKYLLAFGYLDQQGTLINTHLKRYTARVNTVFNVDDRIRIGENLQLSYRDNPRISLHQALYTNEWNNDIYLAMLSQPILPVYDIKGGWAHFFPVEFAANPVAQRTIAKKNKSHFWEIFGNIFAEADIAKYFTIRTSFGGNFSNTYAYNYSITNYLPKDSLPDNKLSESSGYSRSWTWTNTVSFKKSFGSEHSLKVLGGIEAIDNYSRETGGTRRGFFSDDINYLFLTNGSPRTATNYSFASQSTLYSLIADVAYGFREKYYFKSTLRRDGSSIFGPQNRFGWFPSFSGAWRITQENFMRPASFLTDLKLRASWGKTGFYGNTNPNNQYTLYGGSIADAFYDINGNNIPLQGFRSIRLGDPRTGWEENIVTNAGFESILWSGKLSLTIDWYRKIANGLLFPVTLPDLVGGSQPPNVNIGKVKNTGLDLMIASKGSFAKDVMWDAALTFTTYNNRILKLTDIPFFIPNFGGSVGPIVRNEVGHPVGSFYGHQIIGIFRDSMDVANSPIQNDKAPGRFKYADINGKDSNGKLTGKPDGKVNDDDRTHLGNPNPKFTLGLNIEIIYKDFDFSTFFYGSFGNDVLNLPRLMLDFFPAGSAGEIPSAKSKAALYNSWTPQHTNTTVPIAEWNRNFSNLNAQNSYALEKGSYFRNKSIIIGYSLPKSFLKKIKSQKLRIYVQAVNLFTMTNYTGLDPELSGRTDSFGIDYGNYPNNQKQYLFGLNMSL